MEAADDCVLVEKVAVFHEHQQTPEQTQDASVSDVKGSCAAKQECKKWKSCPVKAILQKCFCCCLHQFISYLFLYIDCLCIVP